MNQNDASGIDYRTGSGTTITGPDGMQMFRAFSVASALKLYAKTGIKASRMHTPKTMMAVAEEITGQKFKARDYLAAAAALTEWAQTMKAALPKTLDGKAIP